MVGFVPVTNFWSLALTSYDRSCSTIIFIEWFLVLRVTNTGDFKSGVVPAK